LATKEACVARWLTPVLAVLFLAVPAAQAKAPPDLRICGASGCVAIAQNVAEQLPLWHTMDAAAPGAPAPFYVFRWRWRTTDPEETAFWIPSRQLVRFVNPNLVSWYRVDMHAATPFAAGLAPIAVPKVTRVTVGGRPVRSPATYVRLFSIGRATNVWPAVSGWLRIRFAASGPSPWTDGTANVRISRTANYLLRDDTVFAIPKGIADRVRRGLALTG
jgi:hypothetical protein